MSKSDIETVLISGRGFSLFTAATFIIGEVAGAGILSLSHAVSQAGWGGIALIVFCCICAGISGVYLSECWIILEERYPKYRRGLTRKPFATIGYHAFGPIMSAIVSVLMNVTRIGAGAVFLILSSTLLHALTKSFWHLTLCQWIPITSAILLVPMWLGSPADFWPMAYSAMISTVTGSILLIIQLAIRINKNGYANDYHYSGLENFASAFGTILFAFGGASAFPNFQNDMAHKEKFPVAVIIGFIGLSLLYLPTAGLGYAAFGSLVRDDIIDNFDQSALIYVIQACFLIHCLAVVLIVVNPVFLDLEELINIPKNFGWKRCLFRTAIHLLILFLSLTFPSFGQILDLIGGSTVTFMAFVLPPIFYIKLCMDKNPEWPQRRVPIYLYVAFAIIIVAGLTGGISSTISVLKHWKPLSTACYIKK